MIPISEVPGLVQCAAEEIASRHDGYVEVHRLLLRWCDLSLARSAIARSLRNPADTLAAVRAGAALALIVISACGGQADVSTAAPTATSPAAAAAAPTPTATVATLPPTPSPSPAPFGIRIEPATPAVGAPFAIVVSGLSPGESVILFIVPAGGQAPAPPGTALPPPPSVKANAAGIAMYNLSFSPGTPSYLFPFSVTARRANGEIATVELGMTGATAAAPPPIFTPAPAPTAPAVSQGPFGIRIEPATPAVGEPLAVVITGLSPGESVDLLIGFSLVSTPTQLGPWQSVTANASGIATVSHTFRETRVPPFWSFMAKRASGEGATVSFRVTGAILAAPIVSAVVTPSNVTLRPGQTQQFTVIAKDQNGNTLTGVQVTEWSVFGRSAFPSIPITGGGATAPPCRGGSISATGLFTNVSGYPSDSCYVAAYVISSGSGSQDGMGARSGVVIFQ